MKEILSEVQTWLEQEEPIAVAVVVHAQRPTPRPVGAWMAVTASGKMAGSVSGGCVEGVVFQEAQEVLQTNAPKQVTFRVVDEEGWEVGLACDGEMSVYIEPLTAMHRALLDALARGETVVWVAHLSGEGHLLAWPDGRQKGRADLAPALEGAFPGPLAERRSTPVGECFVQVCAPPPTLTIVGAVHLGQILAR
ncbi:MAG TPA: hypothetical protein EYH28_02095 [Anaerolineaceae bacterium]|nr:hypothetical protein [Anaerolineaceae bacterium]